MIWRKVVGCGMALSVMLLCATTSLAAERNLTKVSADQVEVAPAVMGNPNIEGLDINQTGNSSMPLSLNIERFMTKNVKAYPCSYDEASKQYVYYNDIYRSKTSNEQFNWLELSPSLTAQVMNEFKSVYGSMPTHWYVKVTCNMQNINRPLYYIYWTSSDPDKRDRKSANNGDTKFDCFFPVVDTSEPYYNGIQGVAYYYSNRGGQMNSGFSGLLRLNVIKDAAK